MTEVKKEETVASLFIEMRDKGFHYIVAEYSGGGDSGAVEDIYAVKADLINTEEFDCPMLSDSYISQEDIRKGLALRLDHVNYDHPLMDVLYKQLLNELPDWCNNEGGQGTICIDLSNCEYGCSHGSHYERTDWTEHSGTFEFEA